MTSFVFQQVDTVGGKLLGILMGSQNLRQQLRALHNVYLLSSHGMQPFQEGLFRLLAEQGDKPLDAAGPGVLFELQGSLEQCLADERGGPMLPAHAVTCEQHMAHMSSMHQICHRRANWLQIFYSTAPFLPPIRCHKYHAHFQPCTLLDYLSKKTAFSGVDCQQQVKRYI